MPRPVAQGKASRVADARATNLVDRLAPAALLPYLRLARVDRPTGFWLLAIPCFWSVALASRSIGADYPDAWLLVLFAIGAVVMRAAGCTYNDIVDKDIDAQGRPHAQPSAAERRGQREIRHHFHAGAVHDRACGASLLQRRDRLARALRRSARRCSILWSSVSATGRKRCWGSPSIGARCSAIPPCSAASNWPAVVLYAGAIAWTIGYDTIYAHQDREDDALLGLKSTALKFGRATKAWLCRVLCACLARNHRSRALGRGRDRVPAWHGGCGCPSLLASGHARYRRSGQLPAALPVEPRFRVDRVRGHRARSGSRFAVLGAGNEPGPRDARPEARMTPCC